MALPTTPIPASKKRGGCSGCLIKLAIPAFLLVLCFGCLLATPFILRAAGIISPSAEELYAGAADPVAGAMVDDTLVKSGISGAKSFVLPIKGTDKQLAVVQLDNTVKFEPKDPTGEEGAIMATLMGLAKINESGTNIDRTVLSYLDPSGKPFFAFTAAQKDIEAFADKQITRAEFLARVDANLSGLTDTSRLELLAGSMAEGNLPEFTEADAKFAAEAAVEWIVGKKLVTTNCAPPYTDASCEFRVNAVEVARWQASQTALGGFGLGLTGQRTMSDEAATALGAAQVATNLSAAHDLADEGLREQDPEKMRKAVALRPDDWSLRDRQAAALYAVGDDSGAAAALDEAEELFNDQAQAGGDCQALQRNLLYNRQDAFRQAAELNPNNRAIADRLAQTEATIAAVEAGQDAGYCR
jgi:hypothetical protein